MTALLLTLGNRCECHRSLEMTIKTICPVVCGTPKNPHCSMAISAGHRSKFVAIPRQYEWKILEWYEKPQINKPNKYYRSFSKLKNTYNASSFWTLIKGSGDSEWVLPCGKVRASAGSRATCEWVHSVLPLGLQETPVSGTPVINRGYIRMLFSSYEEFSAFKNLGTVS